MVAAVKWSQNAVGLFWQNTKVKVTTVGHYLQLLTQKR